MKQIKVLFSLNNCLNYAIIILQWIPLITAACEAEGSVDQKESNGVCYRLFVLPVTWSEAANQCRKKGGQLMEVTSSSHVKLSSNFLADHALQNAWIGAQQVPTGWQWSGNDVLGNFNAWSSSTPAEGSHCAAIDPQEETWVRRPCGDSANYICEIASSLEQCRSTADITSVKIGSRCFLLAHGQQVTWFIADNQCTAIGGKLGHVTTSGVHEKLVAEAVSLDGVFWIGLTETAWMWESGDALSRYYWADAQPNRGGECVAAQVYDTSALWDALLCDDDAVDAFICQNVASPVISDQTKKPPKQPAVTPAPSDAPTTNATGTEDDKPGGVSSSLKAGLAVAVVLLLLILGGVVLLFFCYQRRGRMLKEKARAQAIAIRQKQALQGKPFDQQDPEAARLNNNQTQPENIFTTSAASSGKDTTKERLERFQKYAIDDAEPETAKYDAFDSFPHTEANVDTGHKQFYPADSWKFDEFREKPTHKASTSDLRKSSLVPEEKKKEPKKLVHEEKSKTVVNNNKDKVEVIGNIKAVEKDDQVKKKTVEDSPKWADSRRNSIINKESENEESTETDDSESESDFLDSDEEDEILYDKSKGIDNLQNSLPLNQNPLNSKPPRMNSTLPELKHRLGAMDLPPIHKGRPERPKNPQTLRSVSMSDFAAIEAETNEVTVISRGKDAAKKKPRLNHSRTSSMHSVTSIGGGGEEGSDTLAGVGGGETKIMGRQRPHSASMVLDRSPSKVKADADREKEHRRRRRKDDQKEHRRKHRHGDEEQDEEDKERRRRRRHRKHKSKTENGDEDNDDGERRRRHRRRRDGDKSERKEHRHKHRRHRDKGEDTNDKDDDDEARRKRRKDREHKRRHRHEDDDHRRHRKKDQGPEVDDDIEKLFQQDKRKRDMRDSLKGKDHLDVELTDEDSITYVTDDERVRDKDVDATGFSDQGTLQDLLMSVNTALQQHDEKREQEKEKIRSARSARERKRHGDESQRSSRVSSRISSRQTSRDRKSARKRQENQGDSDIKESDRNNKGMDKDVNAKGKENERVGKENEREEKEKPKKKHRPDSAKSLNNSTPDQEKKKKPSKVEKESKDKHFKNNFLTDESDEEKGPLRTKPDTKKVKDKDNESKKNTKVVDDEDEEYDSDQPYTKNRITADLILNKAIMIPTDSALGVSGVVRGVDTDEEEFKVDIPEPKDSGVSTDRGQGSDSPSLSARSTLDNTPVHHAAQTLPAAMGQPWALASGPIQQRTAPLEELKLNLDDILDMSETFVI